MQGNPELWVLLAALILPIRSNVMRTTKNHNDANSVQDVAPDLDRAQG